MGHRPACKMPREDRAKQFMPFAALKGLEEALRKKEKMSVEKLELSDSMAEELNLKFLQLEIGKTVAVTYYLQGEYVKLTGVISAIDNVYHILRVENTKICFDDIIDIELKY